MEENAAVLKLQTLSGTSRSSNSKVAKSATARKRQPAKKKEPERSLPLTGGVITDSKQEQHVDDMMHEFDLYVLYHEIKKKTEEVLSSQEEKFASQEGPQANAATFVSAQPVVNVHTELKNTEIEKDNPNVERREEVQLVVRSSSGVCSSVTNGNEDGVLVGDLTYLSENGNAVGEVLSSVKDLVTCEKDVDCITPDDASSSDDSDEDVTDGDCKQEDYMFPSPEEMEKASVPQVGRVFTTLDEAKRFVNVYALMTGFGIKKRRNNKNRKIAFCCNKSRKTVSTYTGARKRRRNVLNRTNCGMHVTVSLEDGKWHIQSQDLRHNHPLVSSPSLTQFFLSHRSMNEAEMLLSKLLQEHRVKPRKIMSIFRKLCGGKFGNITFDVKRLDNLKQVEREKRRNTDIEHTMNYIEKLQVDKPGFLFKAQRDSANSILSLFWTDSRSRLDYLLFGDIISFDTTFSTNKYNMPFAPIIGVNGHSRTIVFGWALLQDEKADTFKWLFETFDQVMGGKKPRVVLTDQDAAMKVAVPKVFPDAFHRFCIWHVCRKARENLKVYFHLKKGMEKDLEECIMQSITVEEFERKWHEMEEKYSCGKHAHIKRMWDNREYFVPAYFQGVFCPFTRSISRSESFNSNFKDYVLRKDTIETFIHQYELFQENVIYIENQDRFLSNEKVPVMWGYQRFERHAAEVYTRAIYCKFLTEMMNATAFGVKEIDKDKRYELKRNFEYENPEFDREIFTVNTDRATDDFVCECGKFERDGILCCHILRLFTQFDYLKIPEKYIVSRWTREFRETELRKHKFEVLGAQLEDQSHNAVRYAIVMNRVGELCSDISHDSGLCEELLDAVMSVHNKYLLGKQPAVENQEDGDHSESQADVNKGMRDPAVKRNKSVRKGNRLRLCLVGLFEPTSSFSKLEANQRGKSRSRSCKS